jgi:glycine cleavage system protein P-like pyridoxal-binding family
MCMRIFPHPAITGISTTHYPNSSQVVPTYAYVGGYGFNGIQGVIAVANLTVNNIP